MRKGIVIDAEDILRELLKEGKSGCTDATSRSPNRF